MCFLKGNRFESLFSCLFFQFASILTNGTHIFYILEALLLQKTHCHFASTATEAVQIQRRIFFIFYCIDLGSWDIDAAGYMSLHVFTGSRTSITTAFFVSFASCSNVIKSVFFPNSPNMCFSSFFLLYHKFIILQSDQNKAVPQYLKQYGTNQRL